MLRVPDAHAQLDEFLVGEVVEESADQWSGGRELPETMLRRDLPRARRTHDHRVAVILDRRADSAREPGVACGPPQERVRVEQEPHAWPSDTPALQLVLRQRREELLADAQ